MVEGLLYKALIKRIRELDQGEGNALVQRFLQRPQEQTDATAGRIRALADTDSPVTCRDDLLQYLKDTVGFTNELEDITDRLSTLSLRRLVALAIPLWKWRGTEAGLVNLVRFLTGRSASYRDWFQYRTILGESAIGAGDDGGWAVGGEFTRMDEFTSSLRVMDNGLLDEGLLIKLIQMSRPLSERVEVTLVDFLDVFDERLDRWVQKGAGSTSLDLALHRMAIPAGAYAEAVVPTLPVDYMAEMDFSLGATGEHHMDLLCDAAGNKYRVVVRHTAAAGADIEVQWLPNGGGTTVMWSGAAPWSIAANVWYNLRAHLERYTPLAGGGKRLQITVYLDNSKVAVIDQADIPVQSIQGPIRVGAPATNTADNLVSQVWLSRVPMRYAMVGPGGTSMTANFVQ